MSRKLAAVVGIVFVLVASTVLSAGCLDDDDGNGDKWDGVIHVGWLTGDLHHLPYFVAKNADVGGGDSLFKQNGVKVKDAAAAGYANGGVVMDHFGKGDVDIGYLGSPPAIIKHINADIDTVVVGSVNAIGSAIVVKPGITTAEDLKGKTIMTPGGATIQHFLLLKYLEDNGIDVGEVTIDAPVAPNLMLEKLEAGTADAFVAWEPFVGDAVVAGTGEILVYSSEIWDQHICCVVAVDEKFSKDHRSAVVNFLKAHLAALEWINNALDDDTSADYDLLVDIAADFTQRSEATVIQALSNMRYTGELDNAFMDFFTAYVEELISQGTILQDDLEAAGYTDAQDVSDNYVDKSFLQEAKA